MSKLTIVSYESSIRTLPAIRMGDKEILHTVLRPGENTISEETLDAWKDPAAIKPLLLKGGLGGLEITAEDGQPVDHEKALEGLFPGEKLPPAAERLRAAAEEAKRQAAFIQAAARHSDDISA